MPRTSRLGAVALVGFTVAGLLWFWLELAPQRLGFEDTDSPAVSLAYLHAHTEIYAQAGLAVLAVGVTLVISVFVVDELLAPHAGSVARRSLTTIGVIAAACFLLVGVLRLGVRPLLYIDDLDRAWGAAGYVTMQLLTVHGFAQAAILLLCSWIVGVAIVGRRSHAIPTILVVLAAVPALRLVSLIGPLGYALGDWTWVLLIAAIPASIVWPSLLGIVLLRRGSRGDQPATTDTIPASAPATGT